MTEHPASALPVPCNAAFQEHSGAGSEQVHAVFGSGVQCFGPVIYQAVAARRSACETRLGRGRHPQGWATASTTPLSLKSLCGGGVPSSHPSLGLSVFFLSFFTLGTGLARTGTNTGTPHHKKRIMS